MKSHYGHIRILSLLVCWLAIGWTEVAGQAPPGLPSTAPPTATDMPPGLPVPAPPGATDSPPGLSGQGAPATLDAPPGSANPFGAVPGLGGFGGEMGGDFPGPRVTLSSTFQVEKGTRNGRLAVRAELQPNWHIYSTTQAPGATRRAELQVKATPDVKVVGEFQPDHDPFIHEDPAFPGVKLEEFAGEVTWTAPIQLREGVDPEKLKIEVTLNGQVCATAGACELVSDETTTATFGGYYEPPNLSGQIKAASGHVSFQGYLEPKVANPGSTIRLVLSAKLEPTWHIYAYAKTDPDKISKPTLIVLRKTAGWQVGPVDASAKPKEEESGLEDEPILHYHEGSVTWTVPITVPDDAKPGQYELAGSIAYQTCTPETCDPPSGFDFQASIQIGATAEPGSILLSFAPTKYNRVAKLATTSRTKQSIAAEPTGMFVNSSLGFILAAAFLAGMILNVMPCVLPVIGLKLMSFVHQAGGKRGEIFALNMWFSFGLLFVFWVLAALAAFANKGWGSHFNSVGFTITMIGVVFAFGLSLFGVWEIPIPGLVTSGTVQGAAEREGAVGAFSKGILTTILATPCSGPLLVPVVSWSVTQPPELTFLVFTSIGLGMATPYLLVGAFPALINLLPKPGAWMHTFEQLMGFVLMGTAVFLFMSVEYELVIPTLSLLVGIGLACWWVGKTPLTAELSQRLKAWGTGVALIVLFVWFSFNAIRVDKERQLPWEPFSRVVLEDHIKQGRTVFIDFTADW